MNKQHTLILGFCVAFAANEASAALYNLDIQRTRGGITWNAETDDTWTPVLTDGVGSAQDDDWNIIDSGDGVLSNDTITFSNLVDTQGNASSISFSSGLVNTDGYSNDTPRDGVWTSWAYTTGINGSTGADITLSGFEANATFNLIIYTGNARWAGTNGGEFTFGGMTKTYSEAVSGNDMPVVDGQTYIRFNGLTADASGEISGTFGNATGNSHSVLLAGLQIETVPEPSSTALLGLAGIAFLIYRRK